MLKNKTTKSIVFISIAFCLLLTAAAHWGTGSLSIFCMKAFDTAKLFSSYLCLPFFSVDSTDEPLETPFPDATLEPDTPEVAHQFENPGLMEDVTPTPQLMSTPFHDASTSIIEIQTPHQTPTITFIDGSSFFVAPEGSNQNPGTEALPWKTLQYAAAQLQAGQTLYVRGGVYYESINFRQSGSAENPIRVMAYPGEQPVLDGDQFRLPVQYWGALMTISGDYIELSGIEVRFSNWMGILVSGNHSKVANTNSHHHQEQGIFISGDSNIAEYNTVWMNCLSNENGARTRGSWGNGLSAGRHPNHAVIRKNTVYNNWGEGVSTFEANGTIIEDNIVYDNWSTNIYVSDATHILVQRNLVYQSSDSLMTNGSRVGIMMGDERYNPPSSYITIVNNMVYGAYRNFYWWQGLAGGGMDHVIVANNSFVNSRSDGNIRINTGDHNESWFINNIMLQQDTFAIEMIEVHPGLTFSHNLWSKLPSLSVLGLGDLITDPLLMQTGEINAGGMQADWFKLSEVSPAVDRAMPLAEVSTDFFGMVRSGLPDIGAHELIP